jgi:hypothetical protein
VNRSLTHLSLASNAVGSDGVLALTTAMRHNEVRRLLLCCCCCISVVFDTRLFADMRV